MRGPIRLVVLAALTAVLVGLSIALALPFLPAITWAVALAILAWPAHRWISRKLGRGALAAGLSTTLVATLIVGTLAFVAYHIGRETAAVVRRMDEGTADRGGVWKKATELPVVGPAVGWMERVGVDVQATVGAMAESYLKDTSSLAQGSMTAAVQFFVAIFILFYLLRDRDEFLDGLRGLLPLSHAESDLLIERAADSVHATLYATVVTSVIEAVIFAPTFWFAGVPAPVLWSVVIFIVSLLPIVGAILVWVPATIYLALQGKWLAAGAVSAVGVAAHVLIDNLLYARLSGDRLRMHNVLVLIAFLGGLALFGLSGMILGPAILAVTEALLELWRLRAARGRSATLEVCGAPSIIGAESLDDQGSIE